MKRLFLLSIFSFAVLIVLVSCKRYDHKTDFDLMNEIWDEVDTTTEKPIYITSTKPIDSVDIDKLIFDFFRFEIDDYPDTIRAFARVYDSLGHFVTNMADPYTRPPGAKYFHTVDEWLGRHYNIRHAPIPKFTVREYGANDSIPYNIVLSVDYSGSMKPVLNTIFEGTEIFVSLKMPYDNLALTTFNKSLDVKVPMSSDSGRILNIYRANRHRNLGYFSAVNDAVRDGIELFNETPADVPRVMVIFSDGDDNYSKAKLGTLIDSAKKKKIHIFTIAFGYSKDDNLRFLAEYTGGKFYKARSKEELIAIFRDIYMSLRFYYLITYHPPKYWGYHKVLASLHVPGMKDSLYAEGFYDTSDMWRDLGDSFTRPILFDFDSSVVKPESYALIDEIVDQMMSLPRLKLEIQGHTDNIGRVDYNQRLSEDRARAVYDALVSRGVETNRLRFRGFGMSMPVAPNDTDEGRTKNRRTQFVIIAK